MYETKGQMLTTNGCNKKEGWNKDRKWGRLMIS